MYPLIFLLFLLIMHISYILGFSSRDLARSGNTVLRVHGIVNVRAAAVEPEGGAAIPSPPSRYRTARGLALSQQAYFRQLYRKHHY